MDGKTLIVYSENDINEVVAEKIKNFLGIKVDTPIKVMKNRNLNSISQTNGIEFTIYDNQCFVTYEELRKHKSNV